MNGYSEQRNRSARLEVGAAGSGTFAISPDTPGEMRGPKPGEKRGVNADAARALEVLSEAGMRLSVEIFAFDNPLILSPGMERPMAIGCDDNGWAHSDDASTVSGSSVGVVSLTPAAWATELGTDALAQCCCDASPLVMRAGGFVGTV